MKKRILSILLTVCMMLTLLPVTAYAEEAANGVFGEILEDGTYQFTWTLDDQGLLTISGSGDMPDFEQTYRPFEGYETQILDIVIEPGVTSIGSHAFYECEAARTISIPEGVTRIGQRAFYYLGTPEVILPESLEFIDSAAFFGCRVESLRIPAATELHEDVYKVFLACTALKEIQVDENNPHYRSDEQGAVYTKDGTTLLVCPAGFEGAFTVAEGTETIGYSAFQSCIKLTGVKTPGSLKTIDDMAFSNCDTLTDVQLSEGLEVIGNNAFENSEALRTITIPASVKQMGGSVVYSMQFSVEDVIFLGDAPVFDENTFAVSSVTAYYPADNPTWTEDVLQQYGGTVTWVSYTGDAPELPEEPEEPEEPEAGVRRVYGENRYETAYKAADLLKETLGLEKFDSILVANGQAYADALGGAYLAAVRQAPILLVNDHQMQAVADYIAENLAEGGTVYLLGGVNAISEEMATLLADFQVKRLAGDNRYATNLAILEEAGVADKPILVCTGRDFADSLSVSAAGCPILLVNKSLTEEQKALLEASSGEFVIVGGVSAVSADVEAELLEMATLLTRLDGANRYETSVRVARHFFASPTQAVLAYGRNFPDGLCGGPLAYALGAPVILTESRNTAVAAAYTEEVGITQGLVLGGSSLISDAAVRQIFAMAEDAVILE